MVRSYHLRLSDKIGASFSKWVYTYFPVIYKHNYPSVYDLQLLKKSTFVIPVAFNTEHKHMLAHCKAMMEYHNGQVAIHPVKHSKLITALRTAVENGEGDLDKNATSHDDLFDSFRLSLQFWRLPSVSTRQL